MIARSTFAATICTSVVVAGRLPPKRAAPGSDGADLATDLRRRRRTGDLDPVADGGKIFAGRRPDAADARRAPRRDRRRVAHDVSVAVLRDDALGGGSRGFGREPFVPHGLRNMRAQPDPLDAPDPRPSTGNFARPVAVSFLPDDLRPPAARIPSGHRRPPRRGDSPRRRVPRGRPWLPGGYVGVDVFFVLSGFFITGLLAREVVATGDVDLTEFYARRARRLLPAFFVVLARDDRDRALDLRADRSAAHRVRRRAVALHYGNVLFAQDAVNYHATSTNPFLHTWSLAVEEQFYVIWPLLFVFVGRSTPARIRSPAS